MSKREVIKGMLNSVKSDLLEDKLPPLPVSYVISQANGVEEIFVVPPTWDSDVPMHIVKAGIHEVCIKADAYRVVSISIASAEDFGSDLPETWALLIAAQDAYGIQSVVLPFRFKSQGSVEFAEEVWKFHRGGLFSKEYNS